MAKRPHIALLIETSTTFGCGIIRGVAEYARIHGPWIFHIKSSEIGNQILPTAMEWPCDGVIARIEKPQLATALKRRNLPVVYVAGPDYPHWPFIGTSAASIANLAAEHFFDRGFKRFAFFGFEKEHWSLKREQAFIEAIEKAGHTCKVLHDDKYLPTPKREEKLAQWLKSLHKPVAIMAGDDMHGREVIDVCRVCGIEVPEEVAVCGVDNDEMICTMATPSLSSVPINMHRIGYEAAAMMHRMLEGKSWYDIPNIEPLAVMTRQSTDLLAIEDPIVAEAVSMIRQRGAEGLTVKQILQQIPTSRRTLENHFIAALGRTPHDEIRRVQLARVKDLLIRTDLKTSEVARLSGFVNAQYLNNVFKETFSQTPAEFRRSNRIG